jgi:hypothetical protein
VYKTTLVCIPPLFIYQTGAITKMVSSSPIPGSIPTTPYGAPGISPTAPAPTAPIATAPTPLAFGHSADTVKFSGLFGGGKKKTIEPVEGERDKPSLARKAIRAIKSAAPWAIATLIITPFKLVPVVNLLAIPAGLVTMLGGAISAVKGFSNKAARIGKEKPEIAAPPKAPKAAEATPEAEAPPEINEADEPSAD